MIFIISYIVGCLVCLLDYQKEYGNETDESVPLWFMALLGAFWPFYCCIKIIIWALF